MAYVLVVENFLPHEVDADRRIEELFPPSPEQPKRPTALVARSAEAALERLGLNTDFARVNIPEDWKHVPQTVREGLRLVEPDPALTGICCDLEIPARPQSPADVEAGKNLVRLLSYWRDRHPERTFELIVWSAYPQEEPNVAPFCDRFVRKV